VALAVDRVGTVPRAFRVEDPTQAPGGHLRVGSAATSRHHSQAVPGPAPAYVAVSPRSTGLWITAPALPLDSMFSTDRPGCRCNELAPRTIIPVTTRFEAAAPWVQYRQQGGLTFVVSPLRPPI